MDEEERKRNQEQIQAAKEKLRRQKPDLIVNRFPEKSKEIFLALAKEQFAGDYGMTIKWLLDKVMWFDKIEEIEARLTALEQKGIPQERVITMASGRKIKVKRKGEENG